MWKRKERQQRAAGLTSCKVEGGAIRLHSYVAQVLVPFLRALGLSITHAPTNIFAEIRHPNGQGQARNKDVISIVSPARVYISIFKNAIIRFVH